MEYISNSQVEMFNKCQMKWYYSYITRKKEPSSSNQLIGKLWSKLLEDSLLEDNLEYLIDSTISDQLARSETSEERETITRAASYYAIYLPEYRKHYPPDKELHREYSFDLDHLGFRIIGSIDAVSATNIIEDKFLTNRMIDARANMLQNTAQVLTYLSVSRQLGLPRSMEYRITVKPSINRRTKRQPETIEEYEYRLWEQVTTRPHEYFKAYPVSASDHQLDCWERQLYSTHQTMQSIEDGSIPLKNTAACLDYGGCYYIKECTSGFALA